MRKLLLLALGLLTVTPPTFAQETCSASTPRGMEACFRGLNGARQGPGADCDPVKAECRDSIERLTQDGIVNISYSSGYLDAHGSQIDEITQSYFENVFRETILAPCPISHFGFRNVNYGGTPEEIAGVYNDQRDTGCGQAPTTLSRSCGFRRTDDPEVFLKQQVINGKTVIVRVRMTSAPLTRSDSANRNSRRTFIAQRFCSQFKGDQLDQCVANAEPPRTTSAQLLARCQAGDEQRYQICRSDYVRRNWINPLRMVMRS